MKKYVETMLKYILMNPLFFMLSDCHTERTE